MISFANPSWLYGLLGLLIPIGIHLLSRKEGRTIYIGSIRHLSDSDTAQFSSIRLNEIILLILRLLLLTIIVFILAGFSIDLASSNNKKWILIEKGIEKDNRYRAMIDSLNTDGFESRWLANDFFQLHDSAAVETPWNYYKLLLELAPKVDTAIILSYSYARSFKGEKISLPAKIHWLTVEPDEKRIAVDAHLLTKDSVVTRVANSTVGGTSFDYIRTSKNEFEGLKKIGSLQLKSADTIAIAIFSDQKFEYDRKIIQAALTAIESATSKKFKISVTNNAPRADSNFDFVIWLSEQQCPIKENTVIGLATCVDPNLPLLVAGDTNNDCSGNQFDWIISKRLNEENALEESLAFSLAKVIFSNLPVYRNEDINLADQRSFGADAVFNEHIDSEHSSPVVNSSAGIEPSLVILLFLILIAERFMAYKRNQ